MKFLCWLFIVALFAAYTPSFWALNAFPALPEASTPSRDANGINTKADSHVETNRKIYRSKKEVTVLVRGQKGKASPGGGNARRPQKNSASGLVKNPNMFILSTTVLSGSFAWALAFLL